MRSDEIILGHYYQGEDGQVREAIVVPGQGPPGYVEDGGPYEERTDDFWYAVFQPFAPEDNYMDESTVEEFAAWAICEVRPVWVPVNACKTPRGRYEMCELPYEALDLILFMGMPVLAVVWSEMVWRVKYGEPFWPL